MGNPNSPTEVAPSSPAKTTTNAVYLDPGASISQSVYFSGGYADLTLYATQTAANNWYNGLEITIDGQAIEESEGPPLWSGSQNSWSWDRSGGFYTGATAGWHTITFTNTWAAGSGVTVFLDNFGIQTVNGLFNEVAANGQPSITSVQSDVTLCLQFGLHDVGYEGGFDFNQNLGYDDINGYSDMGARGYSSGVPNVAMYANLDPRAQALAINTIAQFYQDGGAMPIIFQSDGNINSWAVLAPDLYSALDETTSVPKVEAVVTVGQSLPPALAYGTPAPGSVNAPAYDWQSPGSRLTETFVVGSPGTYNVGFTIGTTDNGSSGTLQILVDGQLLGSVNVVDSSAGPYTSPAFLSAGQHDVTVVCTAEHSGPYFGLLLASETVQGGGVVNLSGSYNQTGIYVDASTFASTGGFAGDGFAISSNVLGNGTTWDGQPFSFGPAAANDIVSASGQTIALPQTSAGALYLLGAAVYGNQTNQTFTVTYTDGTQQTFTQSFSDWYNGLQGFAGESVALAMPYATLSSGNRFIHSSFYLYGYSFALEAGETIQSITLPNNSHLKIAAMTLGPSVADAGFANPNVVGNGGYTYDPTGTPWTFTGSAGIEADGSAWGAANAPDGDGRAAFLQNLGAISQSVYLAPGTYTASFEAAQRNGYGLQPIQFSVNGTNVGGTITPSGTSWGLYTTTTFTITTAGNYTIQFAGTNSSGDHDSFIDAVSLADPPPDADNAVIPAPPGAAIALSLSSATAGGSRSQDQVPAGQVLGWTAASSPVTPPSVGGVSSLSSVPVAVLLGAPVSPSLPLVDALSGPGSFTAFGTPETPTSFALLSGEISPVFTPVGLGSPVIGPARLAGGADETGAQSGLDETLPVSAMAANVDRVTRPINPGEERLAMRSSSASAELDAKIWQEACDACFTDAFWGQGLLTMTGSEVGVTADEPATATPWEAAVLALALAISGRVKFEAAEEERQTQA